MQFNVNSDWFRGDCEITTYAFEELLGTKLRALYQRKKGRDLFDLQVALDKSSVDVQKVMECYNRYMDFSVEKSPSYKQFMQNMELKMQDSDFLDDTELLLRPDADKFEPERAFQMVRDAFIERLPGRRK
ncbi:MAG: nucleotidyl transferase AbiEii/AbiGii toxin family protein [Fibrobacter sp.]|nr:nucleotidyl transferase AbiEii/AbiGii toxin family protein [Fibrobacter sp.]